MLPQVPPFRFVDRVLEREPLRRCVTIKCFSAGEDCLQGLEHVPFSLVMEALCQSAAFLAADGASGQGRILKVDEAELSGFVKTGETLRITSTLLEASEAVLKAESLGNVEGRRVARLQVLVAR
jgi:3-hydroxyacyl-[acyl-carrier-protein] dehydratase